MSEFAVFPSRKSCVRWRVWPALPRTAAFERARAARVAGGAERPVACERAARVVGGAMQPRTASPRLAPQQWWRASRAGGRRHRAIPIPRHAITGDRRPMRAACLARGLRARSSGLRPGTGTCSIVSFSVAAATRRLLAPHDRATREGVQTCSAGRRHAIWGPADWLPCRDCVGEAPLHSSARCPLLQLQGRLRLANRIEMPFPSVGQPRAQAKFQAVPTTCSS